MPQYSKEHKVTGPHADDNAVARVTAAFHQENTSNRKEIRNHKVVFYVQQTWEKMKNSVSLLKL
jgi:hypothetical protein